jgi:hypothetical protein
MISKSNTVFQNPISNLNPISPLLILKITHDNKPGLYKKQQWFSAKCIMVKNRPKAWVLGDSTQ